MLDLRRYKTHFYRSFLRKVLMGLMLLPGILSAQEIYDPGNSLYVKAGTEIHTVATSPETPVTAKKTVPKVRKQQKTAATGFGKRLKSSAKRQLKATTPDKEAPQPVIVYTGKETSHFTSGRQETHIGILAPIQYTSKAAAAALMPHSIARILSAEDFTQHKYLYKESHRHEGISYLNSCRPPPCA